MAVSAEAQAVLQQALRLDAVERAEMIEALFRSFETPAAETRDSAWAREAERRIDAYEAGSLGADGSDEVISRFTKR